MAGEDRKLIDELRKDPEVKQAIDEEVAFLLAEALEEYKKKAEKKFLKKGEKVYEKPDCIGDYYGGDKKSQMKCRACRFVADCKEATKKTKKK